ncbi:MAG: thermonuclease family protein [Alphaproteobacteria bacterium]|nr:thermonuclease family protein [Alphaproteobacteria bacterium]
MKAAVLALSLILGLNSDAIGESAVVGIATVIDGDTIEIHGQRIRLHGIDAPESRQGCTRPDGTSWRCGQQASLALADHIGTATIRCEPHGHDRYRRIIAVCFKRAEDLNRWMVTSGWAIAYRKYSFDYAADEENAHRAGLQLWSGTFEMPWDWRLHK